MCILFFVYFMCVFGPVRLLYDGWGRALMTDDDDDVVVVVDVVSS